jgi:hypothetical protein
MSSVPWAHSLPPEKQAELAAVLTPKWNRYLQRMQDLRGWAEDGSALFPSVTQHAFLLVDWIEDVLFGGAGGGGKSEAVAAGALQYADVAGYAGLIFRRTYMDLQEPDALIPRMREILAPTDAHWRGDLKEWVFPSGATIGFGHLEHEGDEENYQGAAAQYWAFDEAGQLRPRQMEYVKTRARRRKDVAIPIRFRYTANPGGRAHEWIVDNFIKGAPENGKLYIPSRAMDNPGLDIADYLARLTALTDPVLRAQLRDGDWEMMDRSALICPEWTPAVAATCTRRDDSLPAYFCAHASMDPGGHAKEAARDLFAALWGYLDFNESKLVVTDEWAMRNPATADVGTAAVAAEARRFGAARGEGRVTNTIRVTDLDGRLVNDLKAPPYLLAFQHTEKTEATVWERRLRTAIAQGKVHVHERCTRLLKTLKYARWNDNRTDYERTLETGHADLWKTLIYMFRSVSWQSNPFPPKPLMREEVWAGKQQPSGPEAEAAQRAFRGMKPMK